MLAYYAVISLVAASCSTGTVLPTTVKKNSILPIFNIHTVNNFAYICHLQKTVVSVDIVSTVFNLQIRHLQILWPSKIKEKTIAFGKDCLCFADGQKIRVIDYEGKDICDIFVRSRIYGVYNYQNGFAIITNENDSYVISTLNKNELVVVATFQCPHKVIGVRGFYVLVDTGGSVCLMHFKTLATIITVPYAGSSPSVEFVNNYNSYSFICCDSSGVIKFYNDDSHMAFALNNRFNFSTEYIFDSGDFMIIVPTNDRFVVKCNMKGECEAGVRQFAIFTAVYDTPYSYVVAVRFDNTVIKFKRHIH